MVSVSAHYVRAQPTVVLARGAAPNGSRQGSAPKVLSVPHETCGLFKSRNPLLVVSLTVFHDFQFVAIGAKQILADRLDREVKVAQNACLHFLKLASVREIALESALQFAEVAFRRRCEIVLHS